MSGAGGQQEGGRAFWDEKAPLWVLPTSQPEVSTTGFLPLPRPARRTPWEL